MRRPHGAENTQKLLERSGLASFIEKTISIDEVRRWKPNREVYLHAARSIGVDPERLALIALYEAAMQALDVQGDTLSEVVDKLLALPV